MIGPILGGVAPVSWTNGTASLAFDGNSLFSGGEVAAAVVARAPINGTLPVKNVAIFGQTTQDMIDSASDVDALWAAGKTNVLLVWEGYNSIRLGRTFTQAVADMQAYCAARHAAHPGWKILALTVHPTNTDFGGGNYIYGNGILVQYNELLKSTYRQIGLSGVIDVRQAGSPFNLPDYEPSSFAATGLYADHIHLNAAGYAVVAQFVASALRRLPAR